MKQDKIKNSISIYLAYSVAFFFLMCLGMWQLNKHKIKIDNKSLLASKLEDSPKELLSLDNMINNMEIINIKGDFLENKALFFEPRTHRGKVGYHLIVPLKVDDKYVLVNKGFLDNKEKTSINNKIESVKGLTIKFPNAKFFELKNDPKNNTWYSLDLEQISSYLDLKLEPFLIYQIHNTNSELVSVRPNTISNINHLNYALTWFLLAITLSIILIFFVRKI